MAGGCTWRALGGRDSRTEGPFLTERAGANDDRLIKNDIGCFRKSHFKSRLFKKAISAELTSSAFSCCVQCPQSGKMIVC